MVPSRILGVLLALAIACSAWFGAGRIGTLPPVAIERAEMAPEPAAGTQPAWQPLDQRVLAQWRAPYRLRWELRLDAASPHAYGLLLSLRGAAEVAWDGAPIGHNGLVGTTRDDEQPGTIDRLFALPPFDDGIHRLDVRASSHRLDGQPRWLRPPRADAAFTIGPLDTLLARRYVPWIVAAIAFGAVLVAGLYFATCRRTASRAATGERRLLLLAAIGLLLPAIEAWRPLWGYPYPLHTPRLHLLLLASIAAAALLPAYLAGRFGMPLRRGAIGGFAVALLAIVLLAPGFDARSLFVHLLGLLAALAIALRAPADQRSEAGPIAALLAAMLALPLFDAAAFLDGLYFIALAVMMTFLLLRHGAHLSALGEANAQLQAQRARLAAQLLQRSIHPHWLMNSLTSLQELIEQAPAHASRMVELLADEFRRLRAIGERPLIPLHEEIALCRAHLDILALMHATPIALDVAGAVDRIAVPPGTLHAQIENGLTHAGTAACATAGFALRIERDGTRIAMQLRSPCGRRTSSGTGTGTVFIESSLEAAFPGRWRYRQHANGDGWHSRMEVPCAS